MITRLTAGISAFVAIVATVAAALNADSGHHTALEQGLLLGISLAAAITSSAAFSRLYAEKIQARAVQADAIVRRDAFHPMMMQVLYALSLLVGIDTPTNPARRDHITILLNLLYNLWTQARIWDDQAAPANRKNYDQMCVRALSSLLEPAARDPDTHRALESMANFFASVTADAAHPDTPPLPLAGPWLTLNDVMALPTLAPDTTGLVVEPGGPRRHRPEAGSRNA